MAHSTDTQRGQGRTRRAFRRDVLTLTGAGRRRRYLPRVDHQAPRPRRCRRYAVQQRHQQRQRPPQAQPRSRQRYPQEEVPRCKLLVTKYDTYNRRRCERLLSHTERYREKQPGCFDWSDTAQKQRWSNFPPAGFICVGLMWGNPERGAAERLATLRCRPRRAPRATTACSPNGARRRRALCAEGTGGGFGKDNYYIALIGTPSETDPWQWHWWASSRGQYHDCRRQHCADAQLYRRAARAIHRCEWRHGAPAGRHRRRSVRAGQLAGCHPAASGHPGHQLDRPGTLVPARTARPSSPKGCQPRR